MVCRAEVRIRLGPITKVLVRRTEMFVLFSRKTVVAVELVRVVEGLRRVASEVVAGPGPGVEVALGHLLRRRHGHHGMLGEKIAPNHALIAPTTRRNILLNIYIDISCCVCLRHPGKKMLFPENKLKMLTDVPRTVLQVCSSDL